MGILFPFWLSDLLENIPFTFFFWVLFSFFEKITEFHLHTYYLSRHSTIQLGAD